MQRQLTCLQRPGVGFVGAECSRVIQGLISLLSKTLELLLARRCRLSSCPVSLQPKHSGVFGLHPVPWDALCWRPTFSKWPPNPRRHRPHRPTQASWATNQHHVEYGSWYERDQKYLTESLCPPDARLVSSAHLSGGNRGTLPGRFDHGGTRRPPRGCLSSPGVRNRGSGTPPVKDAGPPSCVMPVHLKNPR